MNGLKHTVLASFLLLAVICAGCAEVETNAFPGRPQLRGEEYVQTILVFGLAKSDGGMVTAAEWQSFVDEYITPRFQQGLTIIDTDGQWMMQTGEVIKEDSRTIFLLYDADNAAEADSSIEYIKDSYKRLFNQEAVLRIDTEAGVSF